MLLKLQYLFVIMVTCSTLAGCSTKTTSTVDSPDAVAVVNNRLLSTDQVKAGLADIAQFRTSRFFTAEQKKSILLDLVDFELILQHAVSEEFHLQNHLLRKVIVQEFIKDRFSHTFDPTEEEMKQFYQKRQDVFDRITVSHILISTKDRSPQAALKKSEELIKQLESGADFSTLATEHSDDKQTGKKGGLLPPINRRVGFEKAFLDVAFAIVNVGEISGPVRTPYGYHIIQLNREQRGFKQNRPDILLIMTQENHKKAYQDFVDDLRAKAEVKINFDKLNEINLTTVIVEEVKSNAD